MDLSKIVKRNREVPVVRAVMTIEVPVEIETITVSSNQSVAFAQMGDKIVLVAEKADGSGSVTPSTSLEMTGEEFASFVKMLMGKAVTLGLLGAEEKAPKPKRPYNRRQSFPALEDAPAPSNLSPLNDRLAQDAADDAKHFDGEVIPDAAEDDIPDPFGMAAF